MTIMKGIFSNGLYTLKGNTVHDATTVATGSELNKTLLWHMRLGHVSEKKLHELSKQGLLEGYHISKIEFRETCTPRKASCVKFTHSTHKSIIDDYSSKVYVYFLKTKD